MLIIFSALNFASSPTRFSNLSALIFKSLDVNAEKFENLIGDDAKFNAEKMISIFKGQDNDFSKAVCLNAAAGLIVAEKYYKFSDAYNKAREHILSGKSFQHLEKIQNV